MIKNKYKDQSPYKIAGIKRSELFNDKKRKRDTSLDGVSKYKKGKGRRKLQSIYLGKNENNGWRF